MALASGTRLGPYEIVALIGSGGMGEVYRARDVRLGRDVAVKVLTGSVGQPSDRLARFEREAKAIAALTHPNICTLYDVGHQDGSDFIVTEYLDGETLAARLSRGRIKFHNVLAIAIDIANALDVAHSHGIVHRDLKPANVMLTKSGTKLLDFGLAKASLESSVDGMTAPTQTQLTGAGMIVGTLPYMAPEQLEGRNADKRTDIWGLGSIVYEMVAGRRAFPESTAARLIATILDSTPPSLSALNSETPAALEHLVRGCLEKQPDDRWQNIRDVRRELQWVAQVNGSAVSVPHRRITNATAIAIFGAGVVIGSVFMIRGRSAEPKSQAVVRSVVNLDPAQTLMRYGTSPLVAISRDGKHVAFTASAQGVERLYVRDLANTLAGPIPAADAAGWPFFSPDSKWLGFFTIGKNGQESKKVAIAGGTPISFCDDCPFFFGFSWASDDSLIGGRGRLGLWRIPPNARTPVLIAGGSTPDEGFRYVDVLPDGQNVLVTNSRGAEDSFDAARIDILSISTGQKKTLVQGGFGPRFARSGHLVYARSDGIYAAPFNLKSSTITGPAIRVVPDVASMPTRGAADFAISDDGTLVYADGGAMGVSDRVVSLEPSGHIQPLLPVHGPFSDPVVSPDGTQVAVRIDGPVPHIAVYRIASSSVARLSSGESITSIPAWTPDGKRILYSTGAPGGTMSTYSQLADGSEKPEALMRADGWADSVDTAGKFLLFERDSGIWQLPLEGDRHPRPTLQEQPTPSKPRLSPDGRFLAYTAAEQGRPNVYVRQWPDLRNKVQISPNGGSDAHWSSNGRTIFYIEGEFGRPKKLIGVPVTSAGSVLVDKRIVVFEDKDGRFLERGYNVAPNASIVMVERAERWPTHLNLVQNWLDELRARVPTK